MTTNTRDLAEVLTVLLRTPQGAALLEDKERLVAVFRTLGVDLAPITDHTALELRALNRQMAELKAQVGGAAQANQNNSLAVLHRELSEMSAIIEQTKREIAALKPDTGTTGSTARILSATEELDAIVTATERATSEILGKTERIQELADQLKGVDGAVVAADEMEAISMDILMACTFQDITGQRITKVVNVLRYLETRINSMVQIWNREGTTEEDAPMTMPGDTRPDAHLLNGPQLEDKANTQVDIDALFAGLRG